MTGIDYCNVRTYFGYMIPYNRVVGTSKYNSFNIVVEISDITLDERLYRGAFKIPLFDKGYKSWCCYFLDIDSIIMEVYAFFVCSYLDRRFRCKNSYFSVPRLKYFLSPRNGYSEYFFIGKSNLLKVSNGVCCRGIAGEYNNRSSLVEEELYSFFRILPNRLIIEIPVWTSCVVTEITVIILR